MKKLKYSLLILVVFGVLATFENCGGSSDETAKDRTIRILTAKTEWTVSSVQTPANTATDPSQWTNFKVSFTKSNMTTSGHPTGAQAVWPSGTYTVSEDGKTITRGDNIVMLFNPITESNFTATFSVPAGTEIGGRIEALGGDYTFNMK